MTSSLSHSLSERSLRLSVIQIAPIWLDAQATWDKLKDYAADAVADGADVITWGESLIPGYPGWISIDTSTAQVPVFTRYWDQAVTLDGPLVADMQSFARTNNVMIIGGVAERHGGSVYATTLTIGNDGELLGRHRKIKPTWRERLVWADGDAHGLITHDTQLGKIGSLSCWENWLPLPRAALYEQEEFVHVGLWPGSDELVGDITSLIAKEGRLWSVAASGLLRPEDFAHLDEKDLPIRQAMSSHPWVRQNGGSQIVAPNGKVVAGPLIDDEGIVSAELTIEPIIKARQIRDAAGHYSRPDLLQLSVNRDTHHPLPGGTAS